MTGLRRGVCRQGPRSVSRPCALEVLTVPRDQREDGRESSAPFMTSLWFAKLPSTACPWAKYASSVAPVCCTKSCSLSAWFVRALLCTDAA